ncbi:MAG TPA: SDR family NAD(P)-dependent oxidoreductase [Acidimicrobiales bacterium]|nr:SDR family NAD(P)-dependent oxidoreductase [Acidimicrobiales bacterium]
MAWEWKDKVAVVTGASSGIGRQVAIDLADRGATVVGVARRQERLDEVIARCATASPRSVAKCIDLSDPDAAARLVEDVEAEVGGIDVLVNNAAVPMRVHAIRLTPAQLEMAMAVNFTSPVRATMAALPGMLSRGHGHVVNVASVAGRVSSPRESAYTASKFALVGWTDAAASDLVGTGVRLHLVIPGPIATEIWEKLDEPAAYRGRFQPPEKVSAAIIECVERGSYERWVPRWPAVMPLFRALAARGYVTAGGWFDRRAVRD